MSSHVEVVGTFKLVFNFGFCLLSENNFMFHLFLETLISVSRLTRSGLSFHFRDVSFELIKDNKVVGCVFLVQKLFKFSLNPIFETILIALHTNIGTKQSIVYENSFMLWHKCLGHISLERIKRLVKEEILRNIDFVDFNTCIECIKGKHTNKTMYLYLLYKKFEALDAFKVFKAEVEKRRKESS